MFAVAKAMARRGAARGRAAIGRVRISKRQTVVGSNVSRSPSDDSDDARLSCTHTSLRRAQRRLTRFYDAALAPSGLTAAQAKIMALVEEMGGSPGGRGPTLRGLADRLGLPISALTHGLRPLTRSGWLTVVPDDADRRTKRAALSDEGKRRVDHMLRLWARVGAQMESALGSGTSEQLRRMADRVADLDYDAMLAIVRSEEV